jgi:CheY-like chemotaxis protein
MSSPKRVLIIDDDQDYSQAIGELLEASGYRVAKASNGKEGMHLAKTDPPDIILLDVIMTERTEGFFVLQELRRMPQHATTPVIVISSIYNDQPGFRVSPDAGWLPANLFLAKPVDPPKLLAEIARLVEAAAVKGSEK